MQKKESQENVPVDLDEFPSAYKEEAENGIPTTIFTTPYDDLSTIANDTIGNTVHPWDLKDGQVLPSYLSPNRRHSRQNSSMPKEEEVVFGQGEQSQVGSLAHSKLPPQLLQEDNETPSTTFSPYWFPKAHIEDAVKKPSIPREHQFAVQERRRWRCYLLTAAIVASISSALIVGVTIVLILSRDKGTVEGQALGQVPPFAPSVSPVISPTASPIRWPTAAPQQNVTFLPTSMPSSRIVSTFDQWNNAAWDEFARLLSGRLPESFELIVEPQQLERPNSDTPQYRAADWLLRDPGYFDLSDDRKMQRYALAVFVFGLNRLPPTPWLNYAINECIWFASHCDENGLIQRLDVRTQNPPMSGPLPVEFVLLSGSLTQLYLQNNALTGTVPRQWFDRMNRLQRLQLTRNNITGSLPSEFGLLGRLSVLGLGRNQFTGTLPRDWGNMENLKTLGLERNELVGTIPAEFGRMNSLEELFLDENFLSGTVPNSLWDLPTLDNVNLSGNNLVGMIGNGSCSVGRLHADCNHEITCNCCTNCDDR